jgi:head-tail adaptor
MFEKTFTFWRRLVGQTPAPTAPAHDDRRLWIRYAADLQGNVQRTEKPGSHKLSATVRDLSQGGANLLVDQPVEAGQMLSLELPAAADEVRTVLACVVRVTPHEGNRWSLGCVFSRELGADDLGSCGAQKTPAAQDDKRIWVRFTCEVTASYRKVGDSAGQSHPAQVLDISANGIGLAVQSTLDAGSLINIDLIDKKGRTVKTMLACVVRTTQRGAGDCAVGCNFIRELSEEELQSWL